MILRPKRFGLVTLALDQSDVSQGSGSYVFSYVLFARGLKTSEFFEISYLLKLVHGVSELVTNYRLPVTGSFAYTETRKYPL